MSTVHYNPPRQVVEYAGHALGPCLLCVLRAKGKQVITHRELWQAALNDGDTDGTVFVPQVDAQINDALLMGMCDLFPGVLVPLCWDDMGAIEPPNPLPVCKWCGGSGHKADAGIQPAAPGLFGNGALKRGRG